MTTFEIGSLTVPPLAIGTMYFGTTVPAETARTCLDTAVDMGATFWDTANNYAFWADGTGDESETVIGDWIAARGAAARDGVVIASKVGARPLPGHADLEHVHGLSAGAVRQQVVDSLRRLRTDRIDLLYAHIDDTEVDFAETLGAFGELKVDGLVREVGASNLTADRLAAAAQTPVPHPYRALQQRFTYLPVADGADTAPQVVLDQATVDLATREHITLIGYSPLLSGAYTRDDRSLAAEYDTPQNAQRLAALRAVSDDVDVEALDAGQVVLAWMTQRLERVLPVVGVSRSDQVVSARQAVDHELPTSVITRLDDARRGSA